MCGIAGIWSSADARPISQTTLRDMTDRLVHRGPDASGIWTGDGIGFGHRRLSIIDLANGQQPMVAADGQTVVTYNGEIYNFPELRRELESLGHAFKTNCDTEVLLNAWRQWGKACVPRLRGMFAFGVWDEREQTLYCVRDRLGIKPLYYATTTDNQVIFASELKGLTAHPAFATEIDPLAVEDYFAFGYVPEPRSIYRAASKLPAGHIASWHKGQSTPTLEQYWDIKFEPDAARSHAETIEELVARLREAVEIRLIADVPLGAFLSGGVDSSAVVAMMAEINQGAVNTYSIGFDVAEFDESEYADVVAAHLGTAHHKTEVAVDDFELLDRIIDLYDEPFADSSALPTFRVSETARRGVTVAISGDGGDENFGGYWRYREFLRGNRLRARTPQALQELGLNVSNRLPYQPRPGLLGKVRNKLQWTCSNPLATYLDSVSVVRRDVRGLLYSDTFHTELGGYSALEVLRRHQQNAATDDVLSQVQYLDFKTYLVDDILTKVDRASMATSLEVRVPLLDHQFVEWAASVPSSMKMQVAGEGKAILKQAMQSKLPEDILYRKKKGFAVPLPRWFRGPLKDTIQQTLRSETLRDSGYFDAAYLDQLASSLNQQWFDCSSELWSLFVFRSFLEKSS